MVNNIYSFQYSFYENENLTSVVISSGVTSIGICAFYLCDNLATVIIDNETVASGLTSRDALGYLIYHATTIYIKDGITPASYVTTNYTNVTDETIGDVAYKKYTK